MVFKKDRLERYGGKNHRVRGKMKEKDAKLAAVMS